MRPPRRASASIEASAQDASRAVRLYCDAVAEAAMTGRGEGVVDSGADIGEMAEPPAEVVAGEAPAEA